MNGQRFVVIDLETTGNSPKKGDRIIQIAAVVIENNCIVDRYMSFINPKKDIPIFIEQLTGITNDMVINAPTFKEVAKDLMELLEDSYFVAHNVYFDLSFLQEELKSCGYQFSGPVLDTVELARVAFPTERSFKLSDLSGEFNMLHESPHRADSDAEATALLMLKIFQTFEGLPVPTLQQLSVLSRSFISDFEDILEEIISEKLVNLKMQQKRKDLEIVRSLAIKKPSSNFNVEELEQTEKLTDLYKLFENNDRSLREILPNYKVRPEQIQLMKEISEAFHTHQHGLFEAATGSGKTIAYLIPALYYSKLKQKPVIVSTYTTNLQTQIMEKEIPFLERILSFSFRATILKGQRHYLCLQKFEQSLKEQEDNYDFILTKAQILLWLTLTETGDVDEINIPSGGRVLWNQLHVDTSSLKGNPFNSLCFYQRAKEKAHNANIIITNHALLLSDLQRENKLLPDYTEVVIDEAHQFHQVAGKQLGERLSYLDMHNLINRLGTSNTNGLLRKVSRLWQEFSLEKDVDIQKLNQMLLDLQEECHQLFSAIHSYVLKRKKENELQNRISFKFETAKENNRAWDGILELANRIRFLLSDVIRVMEQSVTYLGKKSEIIHSTKAKIFIEDYQKVLLTFQDYSRKIHYLFFEDGDRDVSWIEIEPKGAKNAVTLYSQPLEVSNFIADHFFAEKSSAILTSATLSVNQSFDYFIETVGLTDFYPKLLKLSSPFRYKEQVKMFVPSDMPLVNEVSLEDYAEAVAASIGSVAQIAEGKILALFTSYEMLKKTYQLLKDDETLDDFIIMGQGTSGGSRSRLSKNFKQFDKAILLGTSSFWEGVDFPGNELTALIIVRLPFSSPDEPIVAAKSRFLEAKGINSFYRYSLPEAILRFKQGVGRLIRHEDDRGILFVLDHRIIKKGYGKDFVDSIPEMEIETNPMHVLTHSLEKWITS